MSNEPGFRVSYLRVRFSLICVGIGLLIFVIGAIPDPRGLIGLYTRTPDPPIEQAADRQRIVPD